MSGYKFTILTDHPSNRSGYMSVCENLQSQFEKNGISCDVISGQKPWSPFSIRAFLFAEHFERVGFLSVIHDYFRLLIYVLIAQPDLLICNSEKHAMTCLLLKKTLGTKYAVIAHGTYSRRLASKYKGFKTAFAAADKIICVSNYTRDLLLEYVTGNHIIVINNGVSRSFFSDASISKSKRICFNGNLKKRKGLRILISALGQLSTKAMQELELVVIGNLNVVEQQKIQKETNIRIKFFKNISDQKLRELYATSLVNILPSLNIEDTFEGFGLVHVEAISSGTISIGSRNCGNEDAISPGNGYLIEQNDAAALATHIEDIIERSEHSIIKPTGLSPKYWDEVINSYLDELIPLFDNEFQE